MKVEIIVEETNTGYSAYAAEYPVYTVAGTLAELKTNIQDALELYFGVFKEFVCLCNGVVV